MRLRDERSECKRMHGWGSRREILGRRADPRAGRIESSGAEGFLAREFTGSTHLPSDRQVQRMRA